MWFAEIQPDTRASKRGEDKFTVKRKTDLEQNGANSGAPPLDGFWNMTGGNVTFKPRTIFNVLAGVKNVCMHVLPHTATILHNMFHTQFGIFKGSFAKVLPTFCVRWFLFAWCHCMFSPQRGNRNILVWVNSPQTLGRYGADCVQTADKSPPADLKWLVGRVMVNGEGEGNREQGLMNTCCIDLLTGFLSLTIGSSIFRPNAAPALCRAATPATGWVARDPLGPEEREW